jgi:L-fucose isomerase
MNKKIVDIYLPLDSRDEPNAEVWPLAVKQMEELSAVIKAEGWEPHVLNPDKPVASVAEGLKVIRRAKGERFINFFAGWAYPDFSVSPMWQLPAGVPKLMLGSAVPDYPGAVGLMAACAGLAQVGIETSRLFVENFQDHGSYKQALRRFLADGLLPAPVPRTVDIPVSGPDREKAGEALSALRGSIYGAVGPRSMQMWNKISDADFLKYFGVAREGFDGLRLLKKTEKIPDAKAEAAFDFLLRKGMELRLGTDPVKNLTRHMVLFQMKVYYALLQLREEFGLDFMGVQDQLDWIEHCPATDLTLGLLNNRLRPDSDGSTVVTATEADDGAAVTMQVLKLLSGGQPIGFNDFRYWDERRNLYWFVNSGALAPYFAYGSHDSLKGAWSERQTYMYFKQGGGTCTVVVRVPGVVTWARFSYRSGQLYLCAGRGKTDVPTEEQWRERTERCSPDWPQWYLKLCGKIQYYLNSNHPITVLGDYLSPLKALAEEMGIPFECYDEITPEEL